MKKKTTATFIVLCLSLITLFIATIELNIINKKLNNITKEETLLQKIKYSFVQEIKENQKITRNNELQLIISNHNFSNNIHTQQGYRNYYYAPQKEGNKFAYLSVNVTNLSKRQKDINDILNATLLYDNKYEFSCLPLKEDKATGGFTNEVILEPLENQSFYIMTNLPAELISNNKDMSFVLKTPTKKYKLPVKKKK